MPKHNVPSLLGYPSYAETLLGYPLDRFDPGEPDPHPAGLLGPVAPAERPRPEPESLGTLTLFDAWRRYTDGDRADVRIPLSSLDLSGVSALETFGNKIGRSVPVFLKGNLKDALVHGNLSLTLVGEDTVKATMPYELFNFDHKPDGDHLRNAATAIGLGLLDGSAHVRDKYLGRVRPAGDRPFRIYLDGTAKIAPRNHGRPDMTFGQFP